jgi:hypothetical protein
VRSIAARGIYAWAADESMTQPNWPGTGIADGNHPGSRDTTSDQ